MTSISEAYNNWAEQYDTNENKTRDLEAISLRSVLSPLNFDNCMEVGCGTGKNTQWLLTKSTRVLAIDLSEKMLAKAKEKITASNVEFLQADITKPWTFTKASFDLVVFSLVLEHVENIDFIFEQCSKVVESGGHIYIGELHPFKQYNGTKARFTTQEGLQIVTCYNHHISDFTHAASKYGFEIKMIDELFDSEDKETLPRILTLLFRKAN
jgi:ubiquinone/menaquinone biosynthesis C-methylase UbiE